MDEKQIAAHRRTLAWCRSAQANNENVVIVFGNMDTGERHHTITTDGNGIFIFTPGVKSNHGYVYGEPITVGPGYSSEPIADVSDLLVREFYKPVLHPNFGRLFNVLRDKMEFDYYITYR